ncbi:MAG: 3'-5' exonuclease [Christensenellales bacterium]
MCAKCWMIPAFDAISGRGHRKALARAENMLEFITAIQEFMHGNPDATLSDFLANVALVTDSDEQTEINTVTLMTLHSAKGPGVSRCVFHRPGGGHLPAYPLYATEEGIEEERRLCYVGITRAMDRLFMTYAMSRGLFGTTNHNPPSRFLDELPEDVERNDTASGVVTPYADLPRQSVMKAPVLHASGLQNRCHKTKPRLDGSKSRRQGASSAFGGGKVLSLSRAMGLWQRLILAARNQTHRIEICGDEEGRLMEQRLRAIVISSMNMQINITGTITPP